MGNIPTDQDRITALETRITRLEQFLVRECRNWDDADLNAMLEQSSLREEVRTIVNSDVSVSTRLSVVDN